MDSLTERGRSGREVDFLAERWIPWLSGRCPDGKVDDQAEWWTPWLRSGCPG